MTVPRQITHEVCEVATRGRLTQLKNDYDETMVYNEKKKKHDL